MIFESGGERAALRDSAERYVAMRYPAEEHVARLETGTRCDRDRWREIAGMGWLATDLDEDRGGLGLEFSLLVTLGETLAPGLVPEPFLSQTAIAGRILGDMTATDDAVLAAWLAGDVVVALAHHESARAAYYATPVASEFRRTADGFLLNATKATVIDGPVADYLLVSARDAESPHTLALFLVPASCNALEARTYRAFDGRTFADIELRNARLAPDAQLALRTAEEALLDEALARYAVLIAAESLGISRTMIELTSAYLGEREQFGRKLADFQALQHRLADMLLRLTRSESLVEAACILIDEAGYAAAGRAIAAARIGTEDNGVFIAEQAVQLHGAIGMTDEYILAHYVKRITANRFMAGDRAEHVVQFGGQRAG